LAIYRLDFARGQSHFRRMRQQTVIVIAKGACHVLIGAFTPWAAALAQWANSGESPSKMVWLGVILPASMVGAASQLNGFLSGAYQKFVDDREPLKQIIDAQELAAAKSNVATVPAAGAVSKP
jgi:hypothetical protein